MRQHVAPERLLFRLDKVYIGKHPVGLELLCQLGCNSQTSARSVGRKRARGKRQSVKREERTGGGGVGVKPSEGDQLQGEAARAGEER